MRARGVTQIGGLWVWGLDARGSVPWKSAISGASAAWTLDPGGAAS